MEEERGIMFVPNDENCIEIFEHKVDGIESFEDFKKYLERFTELEEENRLYKHRIEVANEYIESRKNNMIAEHCSDLKYILNECDLESSW